MLIQRQKIYSPHKGVSSAGTNLVQSTHFWKLELPQTNHILAASSDENAKNCFFLKIAKNGDDIWTILSFQKVAQLDFQK